MQAVPHWRWCHVSACNPCHWLGRRLQTPWSGFSWWRDSSVSWESGQRDVQQTMGCAGLSSTSSHLLTVQSPVKLFSSNSTHYSLQEKVSICMWVRNIKVGRMTDEPVKTITFVIGPNLNKIIFYSAKFYVSVKLNWSNKNAQYTETRKKKKKVTFLTVST